MIALEKLRSLLVSRLAYHADAFAIGIGAALPWSSTVTSILIVLWLIALLPTLNWPELKREFAAPAGALPLSLFIVAAFGMAWAEVGWAERLGGLDPFIRFLLLPLFIVQFRRSERGLRVMAGFLISCTVMLAASSVMLAWPAGAFSGGPLAGVVARSVGAQTGAFALCGLALLFVAAELARRRNRLATGALALALGFLVNNFVVAAMNFDGYRVAFIPLFIVPLLILLLISRKFGIRATIVAFAAGVAVCAAVAISSPSLQRQLAAEWNALGTGPDLFDRWLGPSRRIFWGRSATFIADAPLAGHGTGSMPQLFARAAAGQTGVYGQLTKHPHQQTLAVGIQLGSIGIAVLWAMWIAHLYLFRGNSLPAWIGFVVVSQNIAGSLLGTELFASAQGWTYVVGVGVAGGMVRRLKAHDAPTQASSGLST